MADNGDHLRELVAEIAAAYFSHSHVTVSEIPHVIEQIASGLAAVGAGGPGAAAPAEAAPNRPTPAQVRRSITPDSLISFEDGKGYKTLRRHLATRGLTPESYRQKWGLPADYPMVAASYSVRRSALAKSLGFGQKGARRSPGGRVRTRRKRTPQPAPAE